MKPSYTITEQPNREIQPVPEFLIISSRKLLLNKRKQSFNCQVR